MNSSTAGAVQKFSRASQLTDYIGHKTKASAIAKDNRPVKIFSKSNGDSLLQSLLPGLFLAQVETRNRVDH